MVNDGNFIESIDVFLLTMAILYRVMDSDFQSPWMVKMDGCSCNVKTPVNPLANEFTQFKLWNINPFPIG